MTECPILRVVQQKFPLYKNVFNKHYYIQVKQGCILCTSNLHTLLIDFNKRVSKYQVILGYTNFHKGTKNQKLLKEILK